MCGPDYPPPKFCKCKEPEIYTLVVKDFDGNEMWQYAVHRCKKCDRMFKDFYTKMGLFNMMRGMYGGNGANVQLTEKRYKKFYTDEVVIK